MPSQKWNIPFLRFFLERKAERHDEASRTSSESYLASRQKLTWPNPVKTVRIVIEKDVGVLLAYNSLVYTAFYDVTASLPMLFAQIYNFNELQIGLSFIPFGIGCTVASVVFGKLMDVNYRRMARQNGFRVDTRRNDDLSGFPIEKARIEVFIIPLYFGIACLLCWGWLLEQNPPLTAPFVLSFIIGLTLTGSFNVMSTMLVDLYPSSPATATAANNLVRCLMGAAGTAVIIQMIDSMGRGWCFTLIAAIVFLTSPLLWLVMRYGPRWREERRVRLVKQKAKLDADGNGGVVPTSPTLGEKQG